ncbi:MAG: protein kinase [Desulfovibrio sp.]|nr:protein kinase [Desulfovibrio sp.]MBI4959746.1 protein kinase [Desulfovibrio sp.]
MRHIGRYEVLGLLGRGGMGAVYKVAMPVTGKIMALKLLAPSPFLASLVGKKEIERRFTAEAAALAGLNHPNVAAVWDFGRTGRRPFFLMEYYCRDLGQVIGETAEVEAPTRRLSLPRAVSYALQTLEGLARLHHAGIVHRDIKPFNLLLTDEDQIKITDFGLSKVRGEALASTSGLKVGSPFYAAPEQEDNPDLAGPRADLYSVGVTLYRMLTGVLPVWPLEGQSLPSALSQDLDEVWDDYFLRALSPRPEIRHRGAREMAAELAVLLEAWKLRLERACRLAEKDPPTPCPIPQSQERARWEPVKISGKHTREQLGLDLLWRPGCYAHQSLVPAAGKVRDEASGLEWQMGGSPYRVTWHEAHEYVAGLNATGFAGARDWRLPTVDELSRILTPPLEFTGHCLDPVFDRELRLLWSADRRAFTQAWFADTELGAFAWADMTCRRHVRAVRTA